VTVIQKRVKLVGTKGTEDVDVIFDSGSTYSCIRPELANRLEVVLKLPAPIELGTAKSGETLKASERVVLDFHLNGLRLSDEFMLIPGLSESAVIGAATLQKWRMKLDFEREDVVVDPKVTKLRLLISRR